MLAMVEGYGRVRCRWLKLLAIVALSAHVLRAANVT